MGWTERENYPRKLLFICSRNKRRSLTAEKIYEGFSRYEVRSAGTQPEARIKVTEGLLGWADVIFLMEKSHLRRIEEKFAGALTGKKIVVLHIADEFEFMDETLIDEILAGISPHVEIPLK